MCVYCTRFGGAVNLNNVAMDIKDLCVYLVDKAHRPAHLGVIFKDSGNALQSKKHTKVIALFICNKDSKNITNCKTLGKIMLLQ